MTNKLLRGVISSEYESLDTLNASYPWVPNRDGVRPTPEAKENKTKKLEAIQAEWKDFVDFIYHYVFDCSFIITADGKKTVPNRHRERLRAGLEDKRGNNVSYRLQPQLFPYQIKRGEHHVMWYPMETQTYTNSEISAHIESELQKVIANRFEGDESRKNRAMTNFDFAWYINPKMTVPEFFHVQVFACIDCGGE